MTKMKNSVTNKVMSNKDVLAYFKTKENFYQYLNTISKKLQSVCNDFYKDNPEDMIEPIYYIISLNTNVPYILNDNKNISITVLDIPLFIYELETEARNAIINVAIGSEIAEDKDTYNDNNKILMVLFQAEGQVLKRHIDDNEKVDKEDPNFVDSIIFTFSTMFGIGLKTYSIVYKKKKKYLEDEITEDHNNYDFKSKTSKKDPNNALLNSLNTITKNINDDSEELDIFADDVTL